jgi:hypothetical protein
MHYTADVLSRLVHGAVDHETGRIYSIGRVQHFLAGEIDLDETTGRHLLKKQAVGIDEKVLIRPRNSRGNMREHEIIPAVHRDQPVARREIDPNLPFLVRNLLPDRLIFAHHRAPVSSRSPRLRGSMIPTAIRCICN